MVNGDLTYSIRNHHFFITRFYTYEYGGPTTHPAKVAF